MNDFADVRRIAARVAEQYKISPPADVERILQAKCKVIQREPRFGVEAYTVLSDQPPTVYLAPQSYAPRMRFTIAHELGHIFIPWHNGETTCNLDDPTWKDNGIRYFDMQELEANVFASELLIPSKWLRQVVEDGLPLEKMIDTITWKTKASVLACLYALEHVLPPGHIIFVKTPQMDYWWRFQSVGTYTWSMPQAQTMAYLRDVCTEFASYEKGNYAIEHFVMCPCPADDIVQRLYDAEGKDFGRLLNRMSNGDPYRISYCVQHILNCLPDDYYVILKPEHGELLPAKSDGCHIRIDTFDRDYEEIASQLRNSGDPYGDLQLTDESRLLYIKQQQYTLPKATKRDSKNLLRELVQRFYYPESIADSVFRHINGVIGSANSRNDLSPGALYTQLKARFSQDSEVGDIVNTKEFDEFLTNRIQEIVERRPK